MFNTRSILKSILITSYRQLVGSSSIRGELTPIEQDILLGVSDHIILCGDSLGCCSDPRSPDFKATQTS